jgi:hypothetical protein
VPDTFAKGVRHFWVGHCANAWLGTGHKSNLLAYRR